MTLSCGSECHPSISAMYEATLPADLVSWKAAIETARGRIAGLVRKTPLEYSPWLSSKHGASVYLKMESEQVTGSFKARGAANKLSKYADTLRDSAGPVTSSTGNHGLGSIHAFQKLGIEGTVYVPTTIAATKKEALLLQGARLCYHGEDCLVTETFARQEAKATHRMFISSYNDVDVICGQGTIGTEIIEDLPNVDVVFASVGGGGLMSGIATYLKATNPKVKVVGCQPIRSKVMYESVKLGKIVEEESEETLSDGTAGGLEEGTITFDLSRDYVDGWVLVSEEEIEKAVYFMVDKHHKVVEGAAGVALAAYLQTAELYKGQRVAIVICGGNIAIEKIRSIINKNTE